MSERRCLCHTNPNGPVPIPAVPALQMGGIARNTKKLLHRIITSMGATLRVNDDMVVRGNVFVTGLSPNTRFAKNASVTES